MITKPVFIEFWVVESGLVNVPVPRKALVNLNEIASVESLGDKTPLRDRCLVTLYEPADSTVEDETGESVVRGRRTLTVKETYEAIQELLQTHATVVRPATYQ
jgi:hypothetical protein